MSFLTSDAIMNALGDVGCQVSASIGETACESAKLGQEYHPFVKLKRFSAQALKLALSGLHERRCG